MLFLFPIIFSPLWPTLQECFYLNHLSYESFQHEKLLKSTKNSIFPLKKETTKAKLPVKHKISYFLKSKAFRHYSSAVVCLDLPRLLSVFFFLATQTAQYAVMVRYKMDRQWVQNQKKFPALSMSFSMKTLIRVTLKDKKNYSESQFVK